MRTRRFAAVFLALCLLTAILPTAAFAADPPKVATPLIQYMKTDNYSGLRILITCATPGSTIVCVYNTVERIVGTGAMEFNLTMPAGGIYLTAVAAKEGYADSEEARIHIPAEIFQDGVEGVNAALPVLYPERSADMFMDVPTYAQYASALTKLVRAGVINGMTPTTFEPDGTLTMAQYVKMLVCAVYQEDDFSEYQYYQVDGRYSTWYSKFVAAAKAGGLADGVDMRYEKLEAPISRYDMARLLVNAAEILGEKLEVPGGIERKIADYYEMPIDVRDVVAKAYGAGLLGGFDQYGNFYGDRNLSRSHSCFTIVRLFDKSERV